MCVCVGGGGGAYLKKGDQISMFELDAVQVPKTHREVSSLLTK